MKFTKSKNGQYFWMVSRVWQETFDVQVLPFWAGRFDDRLKDPLPKHAGPDIIKQLMSGEFLGRVQHNRVGCFDQTFTLSKSVSIVFFGLTPDKVWHKWAKVIEEKSRPIVEEYLNRMTIRLQAGGKVKVPAVGCAIGFIHYKNYFGDPHGHIHYAIPNMAVSKDGTIGSVGNMRSLMQESALHRATFQKGIDDKLQAEGFKTKRVGTYVEVEGIPPKLIDSLSTGRRLMQDIKADKNFDSSLANDFYAREARRKGEPFDPSPQQMFQRVVRMASRLGVDLNSLRRDAGSPPPKTATAASRSEAYDVAREALRSSVKRFGTFTREQYLERLYTLGIGRKTTLEDLTYMGESLLKKRMIKGQDQTKTTEIVKDRKERRRTSTIKLKKKHDQNQQRANAPPGGKIRQNRDERRKEQDKQKEHASQKRQNEKSEQRTADNKRKTQRYGSRKSAKAQEDILQKHGFVKEAWNELKASTKNFGKAVFVSTSRRAKDVIDRLANMVDPAPRVQRVTTHDAERMAQTHLPTHYIKAHIKALFKGILAPGNPHDKAGAAEKIYAKLRTYQRLPRNTVLVIDQKVLDSPRLLHQITKIAKRDKATLVLTRMERPHINVSQTKSFSRSMDRD